MSHQPPFSNHFTDPKESKAASISPPSLLGQMQSNPAPFTHVVAFRSQKVIFQGLQASFSKDVIYRLSDLYLLSSPLWTSLTHLYFFFFFFSFLLKKEKKEKKRPGLKFFDSGRHPVQDQICFIN